MVPISSVWIRGIEEVDIVSDVGYFPGAPFAGGVWYTCLGGTGSREGCARGGATGTGCRDRFG
jgi:hypothetical protein